MLLDQGDLGEVSYRQITDRNIFKDIFECSMNFPKNSLVELRKWEIAKGYRKPEDTLVNLENGRILDIKDQIVGEKVKAEDFGGGSHVVTDLKNVKEQLATYQQHLKEIDEILEKELASRPKGWSGMQWLDEREKKESEKSSLVAKMEELIS